MANSYDEDADERSGNSPRSPRYDPDEGDRPGAGEDEEEEMRLIPLMTEKGEASYAYDGKDMEYAKGACGIVIVNAFF
jgi:hypothetical protein